MEASPPVVGALRGFRKAEKLQLQKDPGQFLRGKSQEAGELLDVDAFRIERGKYLPLQLRELPLLRRKKEKLSLSLKVQKAEHILHAGQELRALADQLITAKGEMIRDPPGQREDLLSLLQGVPHGDGRAGALLCLDHKHRIRETGNQPVSPHKIRGKGRCPRGKFAENSSLLRNSLVELIIAPGVADIRSAAEYGIGPPTALERTPMPRRIDSPGHSAHDADSPSRERPRKDLRDLPSVGAPVSCPDDRDRGTEIGGELSPKVKAGGTVRNLSEPLRKFRIQRRDLPYGKALGKGSLKTSSHSAASSPKSRSSRLR